jgi:ABC-type xylose transport system permease subunit
MESWILFLLLCIPLRLSLALIAKNASYNVLRLLALFAIIIGIGFWVIFLGGYRKTGVETGGKPIWWNNIRPLHGTIFILFAILVLTPYYNNAWYLLLLDVIIGLIAFIVHYSKSQ